MSDNWIVLIPIDPRLVPAPDKQELARRRIAEIAPDAETIEARSTNEICFYEAWSYFERVTCPSCNQDLALEWWLEKLSEDYSEEHGFGLKAFSLPCCQASYNLNELTYDWPQGFAKFAIVVLNPYISDLEDSVKKEFEIILETPLRVVYRHF